MLVQAERKSRSCGLINNALDLQPCNASRVFSCLTLSVVEVRGYRDDGLGHGFAQVVFCRFLHLAQDVRTDLLRRHFLAPHVYPRVAVVRRHDGVGHEPDVFLYFLITEFAANQTLDCVQRVFRIGHRLPLGRNAHQDFAVVLIRHDGRRRARTLRVFNNFGRVALQNRNARVGGSKVNTDNSSHNNLLDLRVDTRTMVGLFSISRVGHINNFLSDNI